MWLVSRSSESNLIVSFEPNKIPPKALIVPVKLPPVEGTNPVKSTVSKEGSAPLLALKNLPSLLDVPCSNFESVIDSSCIFLS